MSSSHEAQGRTFVRFILRERIEHAVQIVSFSSLVITGVAQKFNEHPNAEAVIQAIGGIEVVRTLHRGFGVLLIVETLFHLAVVLHSVVIKREKTRMMFNLQDLRDAAQMVMYFVGLRKERARFDRFDFRQKSEYWSLIWGGFVMITTGLMMWFPVVTTKFISGEFIPAAKAAHGGEGLLAFLAILIWHMYSAHLSPEVFPFDRTIFTGKISEERMIHEHPVEYERILAEERAAEAKAAAKPDSAA